MIENSETTEDSILERLQHYGESWLDEEGYSKLKKKAKKQKALLLMNELDSSLDSKKINTISRRQKKKLKHKNKKAVHVCQQSEITADEISTKPVQKKRRLQLEKMKAELGLMEVRNVNSTEDYDQADKNKSETRGKVEVIVFTDPAKRRKTQKSIPARSVGGTDVEAVDKPDDNAQPEMNLRDARFDVKMFGIKGFRSKDKESAMQDLLIKLGAKPPKRAYHNYKDYIEMRKNEIEAQKDRREMSRQFGSKRTKNAKGNKRSGSRDGVGYLDGQIGSYRSGVQVLKRDDIKRVKKSKVKK